MRFPFEKSSKNGKKLFLQGRKGKQSEPAATAQNLFAVL
jgi:hypothetical protein